MPGVQDIFDRLARLDDVGVDQAVAAALPTADPQALRQATVFLIDRGRPEGLVAVVSEFHRLPPDLQRAVVDLAGELYRPLREAAARRAGQGAANALRVIVQARAVKLAYLIAEQLRHSSVDVRHQAAAALLELAQWIAGSPQVAPGCDAAAATYVLSTIDEAVATFDRHMEPAVLEAMALLMPRPMPKALASLAHSPHPATPVMRNLLKQPTSPAAARALLLLIHLPTVQEAALAGLARVADSERFDDVLYHGCLLRHPGVVRALAKLRSTDRLTAPADRLANLSTRTSRALPDWCLALPLEAPDRLMHLAQLLHSRDAMTRLAALRRLIDLANSGDSDYQPANNIISACCTDAEPRLALLALRHLIRLHWGGLTQLMFKLINSAVPEVRELAKIFLAPLGFDRLWQAWPKLDVNQRLAAGRALVKIDPDFPRQIQHKLTAPDRASKLQALNMVGALSQGMAHLRTLVQLTHDTDEVVASAAVRALGTAPTPEAQSALQRALDHTDTRVRANAVEALQQIESATHVRKLMSMAVHEEARPRANAIGALLQMRTGDAVGALVGMLNDRRADQRTSALWLVDRLGLIEVARHVAELAVTDPDPQVQARAHDVIENLIDSMANVPQDLHAAAPLSAEPGAAVAAPTSLDAPWTSPLTGD